MTLTVHCVEPTFAGTVTSVADEDDISIHDDSTGTVKRYALAQVTSYVERPALCVVDDEGDRQIRTLPSLLPSGASVTVVRADPSDVDSDVYVHRRGNDASVRPHAAPGPAGRRDRAKRSRSVVSS